ncbi:MAG TPA: SDR family oxidoreductase [Elusimicrobiota bacterium]|nr:SDR family oxidoreductase [Elusimicrobiota bacterium]
MKLEGQAVLVTGAARRVGRTIALALAARGARLALHYNSSRREAASLLREVRASGAEADIFQADLASPRAIEVLARKALARFGAVRALVNNASIYERTPLPVADARAWDANMAINARAPFLLARALAPAMRRAGGGKIVNIADWAGLRPYADYIPYCASKAALLCVNQALAKALGPSIQVNAVLPGPVLPPERMGAAERKVVARANLLKRIGSPEDVAQAVLFFLEGSDFATGAQLTVDGGRLIA